MRTPIERTMGRKGGREWPPQHDFHTPARGLPAGVPSQIPASADSTHRKPAKSSAAELFELGLTTAAMSYHTAAIEALEDCTRLAPDHAPAWRKLGALLRLANEDAQADAAERAARDCNHVQWKKASDKRVLARLHRAEQELLEPLRKMPQDEAAQVLRQHLVKHPADAVAARWLGRLEAFSGDMVTARALFERALDLSPDYTGAREDYVGLLIDERQYASIEQTRILLAAAPQNHRYMFLRVRALMDAGLVDDAINLLTDLLRADPHNAQFWATYGVALRATGRREETVQAYRKCLELNPGMGEAWWGLAEMKDKVLTEDDIEAMRAHLEDDTLTPESRMHMLYALGQTLERAGDFAASFAAYEQGAQAFWAGEPDRPKEQPSAIEPVSRVQRIKAVFGRENLTARLAPPASVSEDTPIFVVGMPRAGSTLVEQILSAHSLVEAIGERSLIGDIVRDLALSRMMVTQDAYPECLLTLTQDQFATLGSRVLVESRKYRISGRPFFVDKRPWNWLEVGLIHLILPQAKIIDIRREPMAACFAMYKQMLPRRSCAFSYDLRDLGRYYNRYVNLMEHWQAVLPGRVHLVEYERLVDDPESEIRRMLLHCGLPFEESCLRFWESERAIATPSAEQVRRPIYRNAIEQWRAYEPWLSPLRQALSEPVES